MRQLLLAGTALLCAGSAAFAGSPAPVLSVFGEINAASILCYSHVAGIDPGRDRGPLPHVVYEPGFGDCAEVDRIYQEMIATQKEKSRAADIEHIRRALDDAKRAALQ